MAKHHFKTIVSKGRYHATKAAADAVLAEVWAACADAGTAASFCVLDVPGPAAGPIWVIFRTASRIPSGGGDESLVSVVGKCCYHSEADAAAAFAAFALKTLHSSRTIGDLRDACHCGEFEEAGLRFRLVRAEQ